MVVMIVPDQGKSGTLVESAVGGKMDWRIKSSQYTAVNMTYRISGDETAKTVSSAAPVGSITTTKAKPESEYNYPDPYFDGFEPVCAVLVSDLIQMLPHPCCQRARYSPAGYNIMRAGPRQPDR